MSEASAKASIACLASPIGADRSGLDAMQSMCANYGCHRVCAAVLRCRLYCNMHETLQAFIQCVSGPTFSNNRYWHFIWEMQGLRVRTISYFVPSVPTDEAGWAEHIEEAAVFLRKAQDMFENAGERQSKPPCRPAPLHADARVIKGPYAQPLMRMQVTKCRRYA